MVFLEIDETGGRALSLAEAQRLVASRMMQIFGPQLSQSVQTPQGQIGGMLSVIGVETGESGLDAINQMNPDTAVGVFLDWHGALVNAFRRLASRSRATVTLTGVAGTSVPAGQRVRSSAGDEFQTVSDVVLSASGVTVEAVAVEDGPVPVDAGTVTEIVSVVVGWETVNNTEAGVEGAARQSDAEFRVARERLAVRNGVGALAVLEGAVLFAGVSNVRVVERRAGADEVVQQFALLPSAIAVVVDGGETSAVTRAVEAYRGMGVPTMTSIRGGPPTAALSGVAAGSVEWMGVTYSGVDLSSAVTGADRAAVLTAAMSGSGVTVRFVDGGYVAMFGWQPNMVQQFDGGATAVAFGLDPTAATGASGPFIRARERPLMVTAEVARQVGFPSDGLVLLRSAVSDVVAGYGLGEQLWSNDLLAAMERVPGTRVTTLSVVHDGVSASGVPVPLDGKWTVPTANLTVTIS